MKSKEQSESQLNLNTLPAEIIILIARYCNFIDLHSLIEVSNQLYKTIQSNDVWEYKFMEYVPELYSDYKNRYSHNLDVNEQYWYKHFKQIFKPIMRKISGYDYFKIMCAIRDGIDIEHKTIDKRKALLTANFRALFLRFFDSSTKGEYCPQLLEASSKGSEVFVKNMLNCGANVNFVDRKGLTALHIAVFFEHLNIVTELLKYGADVNIQNKYGHTPLFIAVEKNNFHIASKLIEYGADVNDFSPDMECIPLYTAIAKNNKEMVNILLKNGAKVNIRYANSGGTALFFAVQEQNIEIALKLLEYGADVNDYGENNKFVPLAKACESGSKEIVKLLLEKGAYVNIIQNGATPIVFAAQHGHAETVKVLLQNCADINYKCTNGGYTALHYALAYRHTNVALELLKYNLNVNLQDSNGFTPLHIASAYGNKDIVEILIEKGANINMTNIAMETPMTLALKNCNFDIVVLLRSYISSENNTIKKIACL